MRQKPRITVNGFGITQAEIDAEVQYHPAANFHEAQESAARALVIRELMLLEACQKGLCKSRESVKEEESLIEDLLSKEVSVPEPDKKTCKIYYNNNKKKFFTSPLFEVSHILIAAPAGDKNLREKALHQAQEIIDLLKSGQGRFDVLAREKSSCSSAKDGGRMGQVSKGQTTAEFERALLKMRKGDISTSPVETHYGFHVIKVHECVEGKQLPFESVYEWIRDYLQKASWQRAVSQYISLLAGRAKIEGFTIQGASSPLVQ